MLALSPATNPMHSFLMAFIQLAIAIDVLGCVPLYLGMIEDVPIDKRKSVLHTSLLAGFIVGLVFLFLGRFLLQTLGIILSDFEIAGGLILLLIGVLDLVGEEKIQRKPSESFGIVPLGIPLIVGPATISVLFLLAEHYSPAITLFAFIANLLLVGLVFHYAPIVTRILGKDGMKAVSKVMMLLLIAIGIRMLRMGIIASIQDHLHPAQ
jgi:multiple antibiotic resistance protein